MNKKIEAGKSYRTREGGTIHCIGPHPAKPDILVCLNPSGAVFFYHSDGAIDCDLSNFSEAHARDADLIAEAPARVKVTGYLAVYADDLGLYPCGAFDIGEDERPLAIIDLSREIGEVEVGHGLEKETE